MLTQGILYRAAVAAFCGFAIFAAVRSEGVQAEPGATLGGVRVDVAPLRANAGDPTAAWVQQELPGQLAQALAGHVARGGAPVTIRIDYLTLGPSTGEMLHAAASLDTISGVAIVGGRQIPLSATSSYYSSPVDQTMIERSNRDRVWRLTEVLAFWIGQGAYF